MPRGRRPFPGTAEEKVALRRQRIRVNVQAFRRRKAGAAANQSTSTKSKFRWVPESKWQNEYDYLQQHADDSSDSEAENVSTSSADFGVPPLQAIASDTADEEDVPPSTMTLVQTPTLARQYSHALLATVPVRFLPYRVALPSVPNGVIKIRTPCALWVTSACEVAQLQDSGPLRDVLLSLTLFLASKEEGRPDLGITAQKLYTRSLTKTRRSLQPLLDNDKSPPHTDIVGLFLACHAASVFELLVNSSLTHMAQHVVGIGLLIQHLQTSGLMSDFHTIIGDSLLEEYRMLQMNFSLMHRRPSKLKPKNAQSHLEHANLSIFTNLLDLADQIPPVMVEIDNLRSKSESRPHHCAEKLARLVPVLLHVHNQFKSWNDILRDKMLENSIGLRSESAKDSLDPSTITSYEFAATYTFSVSYDIYALSTAIEAYESSASLVQHLGDDYSLVATLEANTLRDELVNNAAAIVDTMPYFFQTDKGIIGRSIAIWPLEGAWNALANEAIRLDKDEDLLEKIGADFELKIKLQDKEARVRKYLRLCRAVEARAEAYGLPMLTKR